MFSPLEIKRSPILQTVPRSGVSRSQPHPTVFFSKPYLIGYFIEWLSPNRATETG
ncbi:hypothetical protein CKA32_004448 [Geitlerinema sp. FC II]|nr:hypothetical protein CKA32_004448 [Geitlerinema sp. FC II]